MSTGLFATEDRDTLASELSRMARDIRRRPAGNVTLKVKDSTDRIVLHCHETGQVELGMCHVLMRDCIERAGPEVVLTMLIDAFLAMTADSNPGRN